MLDVTTNPNINCMNNAATASASISLDDDMDPLFDDNWLHEHNLDILFDLFEEEIESKGVDGISAGGYNPSSSTILGTSPVTSYLFGTSPSLASALDLYDLLYFDNNQQSINPTQQQQPNQTNSINTSNNATTTINNLHQSNAVVNKSSSLNDVANSASQSSQNVSTNHIANSITNAMRIKRKLKKGHNEGISLLARPNTLSSGNSSNSSSSSSLNNCSSNNNSDKTSTKQLTNSKKTIINSSGGIDINDTKQSHQNRNKHLHYHHHHVHYITGCAIIREHAYAVRGH